MNDTFKAIILTLLIINTPFSLFADGSRGVSGADFLEVSTSTTGISMGEAYTAVPGEITAVYYNPAVVPTLKFPELYVHHQEMIEDSRLEHIGGLYPIRTGGRFYGNLYMGQTVFWVPSFEKVDIDGKNQGEVTFVNSNTEVGYGYSFGEFHTGAKLKYIYQKIDTLNVNSAAVDLGILGGLKIPSPLPSPPQNLYLGMAFQNLGTNAKDDPLPRKLRLGVSYLPTQWAKWNVDINQLVIRNSDLLDFTYGFEETFELNTGLEFDYLDLLFFRTGYRFNDGGGYTLGSGFRYAIGKTAFKVDVSMAETYEFGNTFSVNVSVMLVPKITVEDRKNAKQYYMQGIQYYVEDDLDNAIESFERARSYDPYYKDIDKKIEEMRDLKQLREENQRYELENS
jgi:hypothetical protein